MNAELADELEALADKLQNWNWLAYDMRYAARVERCDPERDDAFKRHYERGALTDGDK